MDFERIEKLRGLAEYLETQILGQPQAVASVSDVLIRAMLGLSDTKRPLGSFLFSGPTGVGKTELARCFTRYLFGEERCHLIRLDMSEYQTKEQLEVLLGDRENPQGQLGRLFARNRNDNGELQGGTFLWDEIEKAHPDLLMLLLQVLDDGRLTLRDGTVLRLNPFFIVLTSNLGANEAMEMRHSNRATVERVVKEIVREHLKPELVNRLTEQVIFHPLDYDAQKAIARLHLQNEIERLNQKPGFALNWSEDILDLILAQGFDQRYGARPLRRTIEKLLGQSLAKSLLSGENAIGHLIANRDKGEITLNFLGNTKPHQHELE